MICQFSFSNYKSYQNETTVDFRAENLNDEFNDSLLDGDLLPANVIYGPNGGGKSNALKALMCLISIVLRPVYETRTNRLPQNVPFSEIPCVPFLFEKEAEKKPTEFLLIFRVRDDEYRYFISLQDDNVVAESLERKRWKAGRIASLFDRDGNRIAIGAGLPKRINAEVNAKMPYLSFLCINHAIPQIQEVQAWFESCLFWNNKSLDSKSVQMLLKQESMHRDFLRIFNDCGMDIRDFRYDPNKHDIIIKYQIPGGTYELSYGDESDGVQKLLTVLPLVQIALKDGRLLIVDELDSNIHPKLLRYVISMFTNPEVNKFGAQLLFTSHDMSTLRSSVFRRDEILFATLNEERKSELFCLYQIRDEHNRHIDMSSAYDMQYLDGRYGADPFIQSGSTGHRI